MRAAWVLALVTTGALLQASLPGLAPARARAADMAPAGSGSSNLTLSVTFAWENAGAPPGPILPVQVRAASAGRLTGPLRVRLLRRVPFDERTVVFELQEPVDIPAGAEWTSWLVLPAGPTRDRLQIELGPATASLDTFDPARRAWPRPVALVLGGSTGGWEFLGRWRLRTAPAHRGVGPAPDALRVVHVSDPSALPPWLAAYQAVGLVVLTAEFPADRLSPAQADALVMYLRGGGIVAIPERVPPSWAPLIQRLEAASHPSVLPSAPAAELFRPRLLRLPMEDRGAALAAFARAAPGLGLEEGPPDQGPAGPGAPSVLAGDELRAQLFDALDAAPVGFPPRWAGLAAVGYGLAAWAWVRRFRERRPGRWLAAGLALVGAASTGAVLGAHAFTARADRPLALLLVRPAHLTGGRVGAAGPVDGLLQAELLVAFPGLFATPWELRPAPGTFTLLPAPLSPAEVPRGTAGIRVRRSPDHVRQGSWRFEPLAAPVPGGADAGEPGPPKTGPGGWRGLFYVDATLEEMVRQVPATARAVVVSPAGVVAARPGELAVVGRTAVVGGRVAQALERLHRTALHPGAGVLEGRIVEALTSASLDTAAQAMVRAVAAAVAEAAAREEGPPGDRSVHYAIWVSQHTNRPVAEARRPGARWAPVPTRVIVVSPAVPAGEGPERSGAGDDGRGSLGAPGRGSGGP